MFRSMHQQLEGGGATSANSPTPPPGACPLAGGLLCFPEEGYCVPICPLISLLKSRWDPPGGGYDWSYFDGVRVVASFVAMRRPQQSERLSTCGTGTLL